MSSKTRSLATLSLFLILSVVICLVPFYYLDEIKRLRGWNYPLIFFISFIAGSSLPIPAPYIAAVFIMAPLLNPFLVGVVAGLGAGVGGTVVYFFGRGGRELIPWINLSSSHSNDSVSLWTHRITDWAQNRGSLVVFLMSAVINPAFGPMAFTFGAVRFQAVKFFLLCWAGNTVKSLFIAYSGYLGLGFLLRWLGVNI